MGNDVPDCRECRRSSMRKLPEGRVGHGVIVDDDVWGLSGRFLRRVFDVCDGNGTEESRRTVHDAACAFHHRACRPVAGEKGANAARPQFVARHPCNLPPAKSGVATYPGLFQNLVRVVRQHAEIQNCGSRSHNRVARGPAVAKPMEGGLLGRYRMTMTNADGTMSRTMLLPALRTEHAGCSPPVALVTVAESVAPPERDVAESSV